MSATHRACSHTELTARYTYKPAASHKAAALPCSNELCLHHMLCTLQPSHLQICACEQGTQAGIYLVAIALKVVVKCELCVGRNVLGSEQADGQLAASNHPLLRFTVGFARVVDESAQRPLHPQQQCKSVRASVKRGDSDNRNGSNRTRTASNLTKLIVCLVT